MAYRDILVPMEAGASGRTRAEFAADLAAKFGARLVGAYAKTQITPPFMPAEAFAVLSAEETKFIYDAHAKVVEATGEQARQAFERAAAARDVVSEWHMLEDAEALVACARRTDLLVHSVETGQLMSAFSPVPLAMAGGGPAIILPADARPSALRHVLVAWNGSREAAHALHAAWPLILLAEQVDILMVSRNGLHEPEGLLQRHFERHGVKPNLILDDSHDAAAGAVLRRRVEALRPDLVVMGLYGRSRIRELVLGGVSRDMVADPLVPLFVCH